MKEDEIWICSGDNERRAVPVKEVSLANLTDEGLRLLFNVSLFGDMPKERKMVRIKIWCDL